MPRLPLHTFQPINTKNAVLNLISYMSALKAKDRYSIIECVRAIDGTELKAFFCEEIVRQGLSYDNNDMTIQYWINEHNKIKTRLAAERSQRDKEKEQRAKKQKAEKKAKLKSSISQLSKQLKTKGARQGIMANSKRQTTSANEPINRVIVSVGNAPAKLIASNVEAKDFTVNKGIIRFQNYELVSVKIGHTITYDILRKVQHRFTLIRDNTIREGKRNLFMFSPSTDLYVLLSEAAKIKAEMIKSLSSAEFPQDGTFALPWENVIFWEGRMCLTHPNMSKAATMQPFVFTHPSIHLSFRDIIDYIKKNCQKFIVNAKGGRIVGVTNFAHFAKMIPHFREHTNISDISITSKYIAAKNGTSYTVDEFRTSSTIKKSPYVSLLAKHHSSQEKIYCLLEHVIHKSSDNTTDEFGFLFTITGRRTYDLMIYENTSDESRTTLVFYVRPSLKDQARRYISHFLGSDLENKRQKLAFGEVRFNDSSIVSVKRVAHTSLNEWRSNVLSLIM